MSDFRAILRRTFEQRTLPSGLTVQLRPVSVVGLLATDRLPAEMVAWFQRRSEGAEVDQAETVRVMVEYLRLSAAASVVEVWDGNDWTDATLGIPEFGRLSLEDQANLIGYAAEHSGFSAAIRAAAA